MADYGSMFHKPSSDGPEPRATAAVLNIGNELLAGEIRNTNGRWLGGELDEIGLRLVTIGVVPDDVERIADFVSWARDRHDVVLLTGGLGPTPDDVTRDAVALAFGVVCEVDHGLEQELLAAGGHMARFASAWSRRPAGSRILEHPAGGAPAFTIANVYALAGDPVEMQATFTLLSEELGRWPRMCVWRRTYAVTEDRVSSILRDVANAWSDVHVCSYPRLAPEGPVVEIVLRATMAAAVEIAGAEVEATLARTGVRPA